MKREAKERGGGGTACRCLKSKRSLEKQRGERGSKNANSARRSITYPEALSPQNASMS